jgi:hypothetical protein
MSVASLCVCAPEKAHSWPDYGSELHDALWPVKRSAAAAMKCARAQFRDGAKLITCHGQPMFETMNSPIMCQFSRDATAS